MPQAANTADPSRFNPAFVWPYQLRMDDFWLAMQDVYDFFRESWVYKA